MTTKLLLGKDLNGNVTYQIPWSDTVYYVNLVAGTPQSLTVPANASSVAFSYTPGTNVFVDPLNTAALPSTTFGATTSNLNPVMRPVIGGSTLSFICNTAAYVQVAFYETNVSSTGIS